MAFDRHPLLGATARTSSNRDARVVSRHQCARRDPFYTNETFFIDSLNLKALVESKTETETIVTLCTPRHARRAQGGQRALRYDVEPASYRGAGTEGVLGRCGMESAAGLPSNRAGRRARRVLGRKARPPSVVRDQSAQGPLLGLRRWRAWRATALGDVARFDTYGSINFNYPAK